MLSMRRRNRQRRADGRQTVTLCFPLVAISGISRYIVVISTADLPSSGVSKAVVRKIALVSRVIANYGHFLKTHFSSLPKFKKSTNQVYCQLLKSIEW